MTNEIREIPLDVIDDPVVAMRTDMDMEKLEELSSSIRENGVIQPITVRPNGERFEIVAGHRRYKASIYAGKVTIPAIIKELNDVDTDTVRIHENLFREDVNPVDEGRYIRKMVDTYDYTPNQLAKMTGKSEAYVRGRYELLDYPEYLLKAVQSEQISISSAQWLCKIDDDRVRSEYTRFAILGGITARRAEAWYRSWQAGSLPREASNYVEPTEVANGEERKIMMPCVLCREEDDIENMQMHYAHAECARAVKNMQEDATKN